MTNVKVAFLGLGVMGYPMAGHLKAKGRHDVTGSVIAPQRRAANNGPNNSAATMPPLRRDAVKNADFVFACDRQ